MIVADALNDQHVARQAVKQCIAQDAAVGQLYLTVTTLPTSRAPSNSGLIPGR